jgi:hypothetical protein
MTLRIPRAACLVLLLALPAGTAGCFNPFDPLISARRGVSAPPPVPIDPRSTLLLFKWCWENRAIDEYRELFTDDYVFVFSQQDSAGNAFREVPWRRTDEMASTTNIFVGGSATEPPADRITLDFTNTLNEFPSSFPGHHPKWHREIRAEVNLRVQRGESALEVRGPGLFFFVRGDSAALPEELIQRGFGPDSTRWYIQRWEDETVATSAGAFSARRVTTSTSAGGAQVEVSQPLPLPPSLATWGAIKAYFLAARP